MSDAMFCAVCGHNPGGILGKFCLCEDCAAYADRKEHKVVFGLECDCRACHVIRYVQRLRALAAPDTPLDGMRDAHAGATANPKACCAKHDAAPDTPEEPQ